MIDFTLRNQTDIIFGKDAEKECGKLLKEFGGTKVLLHHSGEPFVLPLIKKVKNILADEGLPYVELVGVVPNPRLSLVYEGIELCRREKIDCILAVGGGSVIDSAKAIGIGVPYDGDVWDFFLGKLYPSKSLPVGVISTFAGTGSETTRASVITKEEDGLKRSADDADVIKPKFAILNPELTFTVPNYQTASGIADITSHLMENYFSATEGAEFSDWLLVAGLKSVLKNGPIVVQQPENYNARGELMLVAPFCINGILKVGRAGDWACHFLEHEMSAEWDIPHGEGLAVVTPVWMRYVYKKNVELFAKFATRVFNVDYDFDCPEATALKGIEMVEDFFMRLGLPAKIGDFKNIDDVNNSTLRKMAARIPFYGPGNTIGSICPLDENDCYEIFRRCL
ncbi:MAG: iron-containing alcohol dehydrogenase [Lentisphaerae bacterium]|nr:iron-containing alcohol dehydrogenase [Lentisphaerota bacterium]